jgi:hypothetical protein
VHRASIYREAEVSDDKKKLGRPALPLELKRTARISVRTYPDIAEKVARNGTEWLEALIKKAKDAPSI